MQNTVLYSISRISVWSPCKSEEGFHSWMLVEIASGFTATIYNDMYERFKKLPLCGKIRSEIAAKIAVAKNTERIKDTSPILTNNFRQPFEFV